MRILILLSFVLVACSDDALPVADVPTADPDDVRELDDVPSNDVQERDDVEEPDVGVPAAVCPTVDPEIVTFRTEDDVELEAAFFAAPTPGRPAVVLFHMIPPSNTRGNYRRPFIDRLVTQCINVLNVDRRGAGGSGGVALEAYEGPAGAIDARAAFDFLLAHAAAPARTRLAMIGASNGTTSLNDYASLEAPPASLAAAVLLSGGPYTENQNSMTESGLRALPVLFAYPDSEAAWNNGVEENTEPAWRFMSHTASAHGTQMLNDEDAAIAVVAFLAELLVGP
ncbi:MAG: pimeloyl-ACP methyl ester carboxylesterase [Polyangiales bacterium]|jgi:pimeloyl-ACP methyl ester carboxylesterase